MLYGWECWTVDKKIEQRMNIAEMRMLRWTNGGDKRTRKEYKRKRRSSVDYWMR